ncbi:Presenilin-A [Galdieria sulphuraria]|nr:Presenilin-A [Galdieria sulphuraria]
MNHQHGKSHFVSLAIYPVIISILFATIFFCLARWQPICGTNNFSNAETEETVDALSSFGGLGTLAKQLKDHPRELLFASLIAVISFLMSVILITFTLLCLYRYGWIQFIRYWLTFSTAMVLSLTGGTLLIKLCQILCFRLDWLSLCFMMWNFSIGGVFAIFYYAPKWLQHFYLILMASLLSWLFRDFPSVVVGILLAGLAIWDIYAVLSPHGPLRDMIELASERERSIEFPSLVYDTCPYDIDVIIL